MKSGTVTTLCMGLVLILAAFGGPARAADPEAPPKDEAELRARLEGILAENGIPGMGVVIADRSGTRWVAGIGKSNVATGTDAGPDTLFRTGSISKMLVGLAAVRLQREGKLDLSAPVRSLAPEIHCDNPWEATDPVRVVHLLEHTTGWDDITQREWANEDPKPLTLREALDFDPRARTSRWRPGTRFSYSNAGPAVAAYILEKIAGERYEDHATKTFLSPLGMATATFFLTPESDSLLTRLYREDGRTEYPYQHFLMRPSGSLNASPREMGRFITFLLDRGKVGETQVVSAADVERVETPVSYLGARAGLRTGYGLGSSTLLERDGFVWHGHNGGLDGARSELYYLVEPGIGYFFSVNTDGDGYKEIGSLLRAYLTRDVKPPEAAKVVDPGPEPASYAGWYETSSPRIEGLRFVLRLTTLSRVRPSEGGLRVSGWAGHARGHYLATGPGLYRKEGDPEATLALVTDPVEGRLIQTKDVTLTPIPWWLAWLEIALGAAALLGMVSVPLFALVWLPRKLLGRLKGARHFTVRLWPLAAVSAFVAAPLFLLRADTLGRIGPGSVGLTASTLIFAIASVGGLVHILRVPRREVHRFTYAHTLVTSALLSIVTVYLGWYGFIGVHTW